MSSLPKLRVVNPYWDVSEEVRDFEQGKYLPFSAASFAVVVEGQVISSYEELLKLAAEEPYKDKDLLEVKLTEIISGG